MKTRKELDELLWKYMMDCDSEALMQMIKDFTDNMPDAALEKYLSDSLPDSL